jgi:hypothetical protein
VYVCVCVCVCAVLLYVTFAISPLQSFSESVAHIITYVKSRSVMFTFPFNLIGADEKEIAAASAGMTELNSVSIRSIVPSRKGSKTALTSIHNESMGSISSDYVEMAESEEGDWNEEATVNAKYLLTMRKGDQDRLDDHKEYLNDTLIDFWMQWYVIQ